MGKKGKKGGKKIDKYDAEFAERESKQAGETNMNEWDCSVVVRSVAGDAFVVEVWQKTQWG